MPTMQQVAENTDAILILSADGRVHLNQFKTICSYRKPVFIDKPFALSSADAGEIIRLAEEFQIPLMSASSLRHAEVLTECTRGDNLGRTCTARCTSNLRRGIIFGTASIRQNYSFKSWALDAGKSPPSLPIMVISLLEPGKREDGDDPRNPKWPRELWNNAAHQKR